MANIFDSMFSMLESKHDDKSKSKGKSETLKQEPSTSKRYDKPNLFDSMLNNQKSDNKTTKGHKSAIVNFAKNLSKLSFKKETIVDKCIDSDKTKTDISALKKSNDNHDSGDEDGSDLDDFMIVDEASSSDEDAGSDNDQTGMESGNVFNKDINTSTPFVSNTNKISRMKEEADLTVSPIRPTQSSKTSNSLRLNTYNETVYSDVTSDESGEIHSDDNYLDLSDEENLFMKRVRLVKEPKVASTKVTYDELLSKELSLRKLKSQPMMNYPKVQGRDKKGGSRKPNMPQKICIEEFIAEQRSVASSQKKIQDVDPSCTGILNTDTEKLSSLRIQMEDGAKRKISIVNDDDKSSKLCNDSTEKLSDTAAKSNSTEIDKSSKSGLTNANSDDEDTHPSMSLDGLIVVDEAGCESSDHEDSEEEQFEVIDSCLDTDEEDERHSSPQTENNPECKTNIADRKDTFEVNVEDKDHISPSRNSDNLEDESNDSFSDAMVIDEVTSPEVEDSAKQESNGDSGNIVNNKNKMSKDGDDIYNDEENQNEIIPPDDVESPEDRTVTSKMSSSFELNDKSKREEDKIVPEGLEASETDKNCVTSMETVIQKDDHAELLTDVNSSISVNNDVVDMSLNCKELDNDSESDDPKSLVIDENNSQTEDLSETQSEVKNDKNGSQKVTDLVNSDCLPPAIDQSKPSTTLLQTMDLTESCQPAIDADPQNGEDSLKRTSESEGPTDLSSLESFNHKKDTNSESTSSFTTKLQFIDCSQKLEKGPSTKMDLLSEKNLSEKIKSRQSNHNVLNKHEMFPGYYTTVVHVDPAKNPKWNKNKIVLSAEKNVKISELIRDRSVTTSKEPLKTGLQDKVQHKNNLNNELAQDNRSTIPSTSQPVTTSADSSLISCTSVTDAATPSSKSDSATVSASDLLSSTVIMPSSKITVRDVSTLHSDPGSDISSLSSNNLTSSVCVPISCPTDSLASSAIDSSVSDINLSSEKTTLSLVESSYPKLSTVLSSTECERTDSKTLTSCDNSVSSNTTSSPPSNSLAVMSPLSSSGLTSTSKDSSSSSTRTVRVTAHGKFIKTMSLSNVNLSVTNSLKKSQSVNVSPKGQDETKKCENTSPNLIPGPASLVSESGSKNACIILSPDQSTTQGNNSVKILSAKDDLPVTPIQKYMHSLINSSKTGSTASSKSQPTSSVKYLITLKKCDKKGNEVDSQPETILTSDLVQSLTKIGTTSVVNCQKLVISPAKTIKVIPGQPKSLTPSPVANVQVVEPNVPCNKDLSNSTNVTKGSSVLPPPPLVKRPNNYPQEHATDTSATESTPLSLLDVDYPQPIVMSSSLMQYRDITGISVNDSLQKDLQKSSIVQSEENPFKILKVSDSVLEGVGLSKKKKRVRKKSKDPKADQFIYSYPVDYNKSQEKVENQTKETKKASKRSSKKRDSDSLNLISGMTNRQLYMPPKDKLDNFRGRFLVGKVNGAYICFKCKSKFSEVKYFRWHLWYHIHLHSDYCPTCDSQDPLGECTTTDSLLKTVASLENEQIFYVMTKGENADSFETYKSLSEVASDIYPSEKVNNQLLLSETVSLSTQADHEVTNNAKYELDPNATTKEPDATKEELQPDSLNFNNNAPVDNLADDNEDDNFMGLKILNTFSLSTLEVACPGTSTVESTQTQSSLNKNLSSIALSVNTLAVPNSNTLDNSTSSSALKSTTDSIYGPFYKCSLCDFSTLFPDEFRNHVYGIHMSSSIYKCYYCDFASLGAGNYISHYRDHVNSVKEDCVFTCTFPGCEDKVNRLEQHLKHLESHESWTPLCCQCSMEFPCVQSLSEHYKKNLVSLFSCQYCDAKAVDKKTYLHHVSQIHSLKARMVMVRKTLICHVKETSHSTYAVSPTKQPPQSKFLSPTSDVCFSTFICQKCSFVCNDKTEFLNHKRIHSSPESVSDTTLVFTCPSCPAAYSTLNKLWEHLQYHDEVIEFYVYKCSYDDFTTNDQEKGKLLHHPRSKYHELVKQSVIIYRNSIHHCKLCGIKVKDRNIFLRHLLIHGKDGDKIAQSLRSMAEFDISACSKPTLAVKPSPAQPIKQVTKLAKTPSPKKDCSLNQQKRGLARDEPVLPFVAVEEHQPKSEELLKLKTSFNKPVLVVKNPVNMVVQASPTFKYNSQILDQKLKVLYTHKSGFFVCLICQSLFRVKNLLSNHIVEHLEMPYQCSKCGNQNTSYDAAISHALKSHNMDQINIIYSEAINDKITKMAQSLNSKATNVSQSARDEFSKRVNILRQHKTFQSSSNKIKSKVFTSNVPSSTVVSPNSKDAEEHRMENECRSMSAKESEKMAFLQEAETDAALKKLWKRGAESSWCRICSKPFSRSPLADIFIKEHILITHLKYKPYKCQHCDFTAYSRKSFSVHSRTIHAGISTYMEERNIGDIVDLFMKTGNIVVEEFSGDQEDADASGEDLGVEEHSTNISKQPTITSYVCEHCNTKFDCPFKMLRHKKLAHSKTPYNTARKSTTPASVQQLLRQTSETSSSVLCARKSTTKAANNCQSTSATQCARKSTSRKRRQNLQDSANVSSTPDVQKYACQKCNFVTEKRKRAMIYHFKKHGFECFVECNNCQAKYTSMRLLLKHFELIHKGKELHPNYLPIESYFQPISKEEISALKATKQNASKEVLNVAKPTKTLPPFKCVFCDLEEIKEEFMRYHLYIHLDYKPFKCDQCTKAFSDPFQQKQHINGDHPKKAKGIFDKVNIYETKVSEILIDCRRAVQKQQSCRPWDLEVVQNQLLEEFMNPVNWESNKKEEENISVKEEEDIKPGEYLVTLASQSDSFVTNNSFISDESFSYDSDLPDLDVDIKPIVDSTKTLADCVAFKRKSKSSVKSSTSNKHAKVINSNAGSKKKKNLIESVFGVLGKEAKKKPKAPKRPLDLDTESSESKKMRYSGEFAAEVILCYYCSFMSESITAVISHTHDVHLGGRRKNSAVGMLWVDTVTGGTYDFEGHIFSNGFDTNITIEYPYLCGTCNYRSVELNDVHEHEQMQHLGLKSSTAFVIKKSLTTSGGRGRSTVSYDETNRRKPNLTNSEKSKPATKKDKAPATATSTVPSTTSSSKVLLLASSKKVLDSSSSLDTLTASNNTDCKSSSLQYRCSRCSTICHTEYSYRQHLATHKTFKRLVPDLARNPRLKCEICSYRAQDADKFTKHMISHNGPTVMFLCGYCGFKATSTRAIKQHHHKRHENQSFDITKFVDKKSSYKNHSLIVDLDPQVKLENILEMSQERFSGILNTSGNVSFES